MALISPLTDADDANGAAAPLCPGWQTRMVRIVRVVTDDDLGGLVDFLSTAPGQPRMVSGEGYGPALARIDVAPSVAPSVAKDAPGRYRVAVDAWIDDPTGG